MSLKHRRLFSLVGLIVLGVVGLWLFVSGCGEKDPVVSDPPPATKPPELQFKTWEKPAAVLVLSGEQHGYVEPCGCSETQSGGLARRADLISQLTDQGWPVAALDLGGTLKRNNLQSKLKFETILKALEPMRYSALTLGLEELQLGEGYLLNTHQSRLNPSGADVHPVLAAANVVIFDSPDLGPVRRQTVTVGDVKIGVSAIVGLSVKNQLLAAGADETLLAIKPPAEVLPGIVQDLKAQNTAFNVLLSHATFEETEELLKQFPEFEIAFCTSGGEEALDDPKTVGKSLVIQVGWKGKYVGLLAYYPDQENQKFQYELVELDNQNFQNDPSVEPYLIAYQERLKQQATDIFAELGTPGREETYVGAATCGECHKKAFAKWSSSKHAHAYETLKTGRKGQYSQPIARIHDPECLSCHVTGWDPQGVTRFESGFLPESLAEMKKQPELFLNLQGQQCENCHGPGSEHVAQERLFQTDRDRADMKKISAARLRMQLKLDVAEKHLCIKCHDYENSPKFGFKKYWDEVKHPYRD